MTNTEAQALLNNLLSEAEKGCQIAKTAARNQKSLSGDNPYGTRFHAVNVALSTMEGKLRSFLAGLELASSDLDTFSTSLTSLKSTATKPKDRASAVKALRLLSDSVIAPKMEAMTASPIPATEQVLPLAVVKKTRGFLEKIVIQANGCYERQWYDASSIMIRKLVEVLIILVFEKKGVTNEIKQGDGSFFMLGKLITAILGKAVWNLHRDTCRTLPQLQELGNRSAHERHYLATKQDIDKAVSGLRMTVDDLLHQAGLK